jgi:hypothetical protein
MKSTYARIELCQRHTRDRPQCIVGPRSLRTVLRAREDDAGVSYLPGSVGDGYQRAMSLRKAEGLARGVAWSNEQENRDGWLRAWKWLEPEFGDCDPKTIIAEHFSHE